jgi:hypothetical protein
MSSNVINWIDPPSGASGFPQIPWDFFAITPDSTARHEYVATMKTTLEAQLATLTQNLLDFDPDLWDPSFIDVSLKYPDFATVDNVPGPPTLTAVERPEPPRPNFTELNDVEPVDIPQWLSDDLDVDIASMPDPDMPELTAVAPTTYLPEFPVLNDLEDPEEPVMLSIDIPTFSSVDFPTFDDTLEEVVLYEPSTTVDIGDNEYRSMVKDRLTAWVEDGLLYGGTGLAPQVEEDIFNRESERSLLVHENTLNKLRTDWSKGHFPLPTSMLLGMITEAETDFANKRLDTSRDIAIKQAELAQENTKFIVQQAANIEQLYLGWFDKVANRTFEASKFAVQSNLDLFKANVQKYNLLVDVYKTKIQLYESRTNAAVKQLEGQKIQIERARLIGDINKQEIDLYKARLDALMMYVQKYKIEMEGAKIFLEGEQTKLQTYKTEVEAFVARTNAAVAAYNMYNTQMEGEKIRVQAYATMVDAYGKRMQAAKIGVDAQLAVINAQSESNKNLALIYEADVKKFSEIVKADIGFAEEQEKIYNTQMRGYDTKARMLEVQGGLTLKEIDLVMKEAEIEFQSKLESYKFQFNQILENWKLRFGIMTTEAQVLAQVASAALASDSQTVHLSESKVATAAGSSNISSSEQEYWDRTV